MTLRGMCLAVLAAMVLNAGCGQPAEKALRDRVTTYWEARTNGDLASAYPFYEPTFRGTYSLNQFLSEFQRLLRFKPEFVAIDHVRFDREGRSATVGVRLKSKPEILAGETLVSTSDETWLLVDDVWYRQSETNTPTNQ